MILLLAIGPLLSACATSIPGLDRVLFANSSANVGPLVAADTALDEAATESEQTSNVDTKATTSRQNSDSNVVSASSASVATTESRDTELAPSIESAAPSEQSNQEIAIEYGAVTGKVVLLGADQQTLSAIGTMVTVTPQAMLDEVANRPAQVHIIDMENKEYLPRYSTIHAGDQVVFVNKDQIQHNVFSSSGKNAFDLGTYGAGLKRAVTLQEPGVVKIYCNIHAEMATFVAVGDQGLSVKADDEGRYQVNQVLPGMYEVSIWNIRGETKRVVEVKANETLELVDQIDTTITKVEPHKNKFGGNYSKNSTIFEDEFY